MSLFIKATSVERECPVLVNMDLVIEIAPVNGGGCELFFVNPEAIPLKPAGSVKQFNLGRSSIRVKESFSQFEQFAVEPVSSEMVQKRIEGLKPKAAKE